jgi:DNA repair exonuclease SbcCD ATPase subunit
MRIIHIHSENVKRIKVVDFSPDPTMQVVSGKNASGKSSLLDSVYMALAGEDAIPGKPVREGCDKALVRLNLGTLIVERRFTAAGGTKLSITNEEGLAYKTPQTMLDAMLGELTFDPLEFTRKRPADQVAELLRISKVDIDIPALDKANAADYEERKSINREAKQKRAQAEAIIVPADAPDACIDESVYLDKIQSAASFNADIERRRQNRTKAAQDITELRKKAQLSLDAIPTVQDKAKEKVEELRRQIAQIEKDTTEEVSRLLAESFKAQDESDVLHAQLAAAGPLPDPLSIIELRASLDSCKAQNAAYAKRQERQRVEGAAASLEAESAALTQRIANREQQKLEAIKAANMPVEGLGFGEGFITFNGQPFDQASSAEQLRVSASIAMAGNPRLRIIRIKDGGLLDDDGMRLLTEMAKDREYQVWVESVKAEAGVGIVMEDGEVKNA